MNVIGTSGVGWRHLAHHELLPPLCVMPIDAGPIDAAGFERYGISCPPAIARSLPRRQAEFLSGRRAAAHALAAIGIAATDVPIGPSREPVWPAGVIGSISHNGRYAAAIAAVRGRHSGVGIDLETVDDTNVEALLDVVVSREEAALLDHLAGALSRATLLTLVFSAKETLFKALFASVGRYFDFSAARVQGVDPVRRAVQLVLQEDLSGEFQRGGRCAVSFEFLDHDTILTSFAW